MSDIYAKPDLYRKVRYNKKLEGDGAEWEEREVAIYESADNMRDDHTGFQSQEGGAPTQTPPPVQGKSSRGAAVCLGVLCLLMGGAIVILSIHYILVRLENEQLSITVQKEQIRYNNLSNSYNQSQNQVKMMKNQMEGSGPQDCQDLPRTRYMQHVVMAKENGLKAIIIIRPGSVRSRCSDSPGDTELCSVGMKLLIKSDQRQ